jgi:hypothetical protein
MAEGFVSTLEREPIHRDSWPNRQGARTGTLEYAEDFYNTGRRHSALGNVSPGKDEEVRLRGGAVAQRQTVRGRRCKCTTLQIVVLSQIVSQHLFKVPLLVGSGSCLNPSFVFFSSRFPVSLELCRPLELTKLGSRPECIEWVGIEVLVRDL